jgi:hypothetical protein
MLQAVSQTFHTHFGGLIKNTRMVKSKATYFHMGGRGEMKSNSGKISVVCFLIVLMLALPLVKTSLARASGSAPTRDEMVACEIALLELTTGGTQLTPDERRQAAEAVDSGMRGNSEVFLRNYAAAIQLLKRAAGDHVYAAALRQALRFNVETANSPAGLEQSYAIERQIIHTHDPTVVLDRNRKHIITESTLRDLYTESVWFAEKTSLPGPSADFKDHLRAWLKASYAGMYDELAESLANEPQNFPLLADIVNRSDPQERKAALQALRTKLEADAQPTRDEVLAGGVALAAKRAVQQSNQTSNGTEANGFLTNTTVHWINMCGPYSR